MTRVPVLSSRRERRHLFVGLAFLAPNIVGVLVFTVFPVIFAIILALTDWDLTRHNMFKPQPVRFVGLNNFFRLVREDNFLQYLGNTLFLMIGIPFEIAGSLIAAILLSKDTRGGGGKAFRWLFAGACLFAAISMLTVVGLHTGATMVLLTGVACGVLLLGVTAGKTAYRTLFYTPFFTSGVATILLWKKLYNPEVGPINAALRPVLDSVGSVVAASPPALIRLGSCIACALMLAIFAWSLRTLWRLWKDDERGNALLLAAAMLVIELILLGLALILWNLPAMPRPFNPPGWISSYNSAKPAIMIISFWAAIGSNNMLLYLAALSNVPQELYEACDLDGANRWQRFWHVTWPQLAPVTYFIVVMSVIGGLQGGFEIARVLTQGGPAGATTTLSYFIYLEGFETGRLGFSAAIAWTLFLMTFVLTVLSRRFAAQYVEE